MDLSKLSDDELARHAYVSLDSLTSTALEREMLRRFEENSAVLAAYEPVRDYLDSFNWTKAHDVQNFKNVISFCEDNTVEHVKALIDVLAEFDIDNPAQLKKALERNAKFEGLLSDLAEPIASLHSLITTPE